MIHVQKWNSCRLDRCGPVYILTLTGNGGHLLNPSSIDDLFVALTVVEQSSDAGALVTTNEGRFFCNGFDLNWLLYGGLTSATTELIRDKYEGLLCLFMKLGIPTIAAVCGHASAAGFVITLVHDYRFIMNRRAVLYMGELDRGMIMPRSVISVLRSKLLPVAVREVVLKARKFTASEALGFSIVDGVYDDSAKTLEAAIAEAEKLASNDWNRDSYAKLRSRNCPGVIEELEAHRDPYVWGKGAML